MSFETMDEDEFLKIFESCRFPLAEWKHLPHVTVAYLYLQRYSYEDALQRIRDAIQAHNAAHKVIGGYHETLTQVWLRIVHAMMVAHGRGDSARNFFNRHSYLLNRMLPLLYYSYGRIMSATARAGFVEPDLAPLPLPPEPAVTNATYEKDTGFPPLPPDPFHTIAMANAASEQGTDNHSVYLMRAWALFELGRDVEAQKDCDRVLGLDPENERAFYCLAGIHLRSNHSVEALRFLEQALRRGLRSELVLRDSQWKNMYENMVFHELMQKFSGS